MKKIVSIIFVLAIGITSVFAGPFGLEKGMSYDQVKEACGGREPVSVGDGRYLIVPLKPHPYFKSYVAWIDEKEGLHFIKAIGTDISTNSYGFNLKDKYNSLEAALSKTYGHCDRIDFLLPGSIWDDPEEWMRAMEKKERYLMSKWSKEYDSNLSNSITSIFLAAFADSSTSGYVCLEYEFSNHQKISDAQKAEEDSVF